MKKNLYTSLIEYSGNGKMAMHMPGHKRAGVKMVNPYDIDITEIEGFDNLHNPEGIIKDEQERLARLYKADRAYLLVNGSTCGNLAAIYASLNKGDKVVIPKGAHKSVYNAVEITEAKALWFEDCFKRNSNQSWELTADISDVKAVVVTSPDFNGYVVDIKEISKLVHDAGAILIVDSAHGAHLGFSKSFPENPIKQGADAVVVSLHKTLPALTQTSALLVCGDRIDTDRLDHAIDIFETSSPSYVLMSSASICLDFLEEQGESAFDAYFRRLTDLYEKSKVLKNIELIDLPIEEKDPSKIVISGKKSGIPGYMISQMLREEYRIEPEMTSKNEVLALSSVMDDEEALDRLYNALCGMDLKLLEFDKSEIETSYTEHFAELKELEGTVSKTMITIYPPGSPILMPGDVVTEDALKKIAEAQAYRLCVTGLSIVK